MDFGKRWNLVAFETWSQEMSGLFINLPTREHGVDIALYFRRVSMGGVRVRFLIIILIIMLSVI